MAATVTLAPVSTKSVRSTANGGRWLRRGVVLLLLVGVGVAVRHFYLTPTVVPVTVTRAETGRVEELVTNNKAGTISARRRSALSPEIGGRVAWLNVEEGQTVRKGNVLLSLADVEWRAQLSLQQQALEVARASGAEVCALAEQTAVDAERAIRLFDIGGMARQDYEQALSRRTATQAGCVAARARVGQAAAAVDAAHAALAKTVLVAPFDAIVSRVETHVGEWLTPSPAGLPMPTALELIDPASIYLRAPLDEVDAGRVRAGLSARVSMDAFPGRTFAAHVTRVGSYVSEAQQQNRTFDVEVTFDEASAGATLLPGTSADVEIVLRAHEGVLRVPTSAILQGSRVLVVRRDVLTSVPVTLGYANWEVTEIRSGVTPGDLVVTSLDREEVREGVRVRIEGGVSK